MLCNEGHRQALKARKERDKTRQRLINIQFLHKFQSNIYISREYTNDLIHPLVPADVLLSDDNIHTELFGCHLSNTFDDKFQPHSLLDLTDENYQINFNPILEERNVEYEHILNDSELNDIGILKNN